MPEPVIGRLKYRVVNWFNGYNTGTNVVAVYDLQHPHQSTWTDRGMQPGAPAQSAIGDFTIPLFPPGTEQYAANKADYDKLLPGSGEGLRVEAYLGDVFGGPSDGSFPDVFLAHAGIITEVILSDDPPRFELHGSTDAWIAAMQRPYPGEILHNSAYDSATIVKEFIPVNIVKVSDQFNPYTAGNYTSTNLAGLTAGTWTATTDANGINSNVVTVATGTGALLINKSQMGFGNDPVDTQMVECICRLKPSGTSATNAGQAGIGMSFDRLSPVSDCLFGYVTAKWNAATSRYDLDATLSRYVAGVLSGPLTISNALTSVDDPDGFIPLQLQFIQQQHTPGPVGYVRFIVNGSPVNAAQTGSAYPGLTVVYPMLMYGAPATGAATAYFTNLMLANRGNGPFAGIVASATHKFRVNQALPPTFLDMWQAVCTLEGWYWRIRPTSQLDGGQIAIGYVDMNSSPGSDLSAIVIFEKGQNLLGITQQGNSDSFASDIQFNGAADSAGGGIFYGRNLTAMTTYGWLSSVGMSLTVMDIANLQRQGQQVTANKGTPGGSYTARVLRDASTADKFRELDTITIHDPDLGIYHKKMLVISRTFTEGSAEETLVLGQYGADSYVAGQRALPGLPHLAGLFKSR